MQFWKIKKEYILSAVLVASLGMPSFAQMKSFHDVTNQTWGYEAIQTMNEKKVIMGYSNGDFKPEQAVTRAEFAAMINRLFGLKEKGEIAYQDISKSYWAMGEIQIATKAGYMKGDEKGLFNPNRMVTRNEMAVVLDKLLELDEKEWKQLPAMNHVPKWARASAQRLVAAGVMTESDFKNLKPLKRVDLAVAFQTVLNTYIEAEPADSDKKDETASNSTEKPTPTIPSTGQPIVPPTVPPVVQPEVPSADVIKHIDTVVSDLQKWVMPRTKTNTQRTVVDKIIESMSAYKNNVHHDVASDVASVRQIRSTMTQEEATALKDLISGFVNSGSLRQLNQIFNLID